MAGVRHGAGKDRATMGCQPRVNLNPLQRDIMRAVLAGHQLIAIQAGWASGKTTGLALALGAVNEMRGGLRQWWVMDTYPRAKSVSIPACRDWLKPQGWSESEQGLSWAAPNGGELHLKNYYSSGGEDGERLEGANITAAARRAGPPAGLRHQGHLVGEQAQPAD
mgnify:CR=1 FL=1